MSEQEKRPSDNQPASPDEHRYRMRHDWHDLIEDLIAEGQEAGLFDNLPGAGQPLRHRKNPYAPELDFAHSLLKDNDMAPAWISERRRLLQQVSSLRETIQRRWRHFEREYRAAGTAVRRNELVFSWDELCRRWQQEIDRLNRTIDSYNLKRPIANLELLKLSLPAELERAGARRYL